MWFIKKEVATAACDSQFGPVLTPRNIKQLRNLRYQHLNDIRLSRISLYNLHEIAYDIPGFIWKISTFPDLICVYGLEEIITEFDRVLHIDSNKQLLSYDTTFQLGDFYVSPLMFRHLLFKENPCIPALFLVHERKLTETHEAMFKECVERIPSLAKTCFPIVTDKERSIINAIKSELPGIKLLYCWNHIFRDVQVWCRKHGAPKSDVSVYTEDLRLLFHSSSEETYMQKLSDMKKAWDSTFEDYFMREIQPEVPISIGHWILEKYSVYNPYSGVTNYQSESFNRYVRNVFLNVNMYY